MNPKKPNILLMYADDMGYGDFGLFNDGHVRTPNLDDLITQSTCLTQHYSGSPVCSPSRASLLTGRYPHRTGAITPQETRGMDRIHTSEVTIGDVFKKNGYSTGMVGKWHNGALDQRYHPNNRGFEEFIGFSGGWADYYRWNLDVNGTVRKADGSYLTDVLCDAAVDFVKRHANEPFLLLVPFNAPHSPLQAPEKLTQEYEEMGLNRGVSLTYAMIETMDQAVGRILETLEKCGLANNTIVLFTSDNGPAFLLRDDQVPEGVSIDTSRYNCGYNGSKGSVYEGGIRVPMIIRWPDGLPNGPKEIHEMVHFTDWLPTLMAAANIIHEFPKKLDGKDVLRQIRGEKLWHQPPRFWQFNNYQPARFVNAACRENDWKLIRPQISPGYSAASDKILEEQYITTDIEYKYNPENVKEITSTKDPNYVWPNPPVPELFNIKEDPLELNNVANKYPDKAKKLLRDLENWFDEMEQELRYSQKETLGR